MKDKAVDGVFVPNVPFSVSRNPDFCKDLKYANILLFDKGKRVLPLGNAEGDEVDTMIAPGTELKINEEVDDFTTVWICGEQPFYD